MSNLLIAWLTIIRKEMSRIFRIWPQSLLPSVITMSLYFLIFGRLIGSRVGSLDGVPYVLYITPGLIMMSVINNAYANVSSSLFGAKFGRSIEELVVSPVSNSVILWGYVMAGMLRGLLVGLLVLLVATFFTHIRITHIWLTLLVILLSSALFAMAGFINALLAKKFDDVTIIPTFILTPLTYVGGVFYSINMLSGTWQHLARLNPIFYIVNGFRYGMIGRSDISEWLCLVIILVFISVFYGIAMWMLKRGYGLRN